MRSSESAPSGGTGHVGETLRVALQPQEFESPTLRTRPQRALLMVGNSCYYQFAFLRRAQKLGSQRAVLRNRPCFLLVRPANEGAQAGMPALLPFLRLLP